MCLSSESRVSSDAPSSPSLTEVFTLLGNEIVDRGAYDALGDVAHGFQHIPEDGRIVPLLYRLPDLCDLGHEIIYAGLPLHLLHSFLKDRQQLTKLFGFLGA